MKYIITLVLGILLGWYLCQHVGTFKRSIQKKGHEFVSSVVSDVVGSVVEESVSSVSESVNGIGNKVIDDSFENIGNLNMRIDTNKVIELSELGE